MDREEDLRAKTKQVLLEYFSLIPHDAAGKPETPGSHTRTSDQNTSPTLETVKSDFHGSYGRILVKSPSGDIFSRSPDQHHDPTSDDRVLEKRMRGNKSVPWLFKQEDDEVNDLLKHYVKHTKYENGQMIARSKSFESAKYYLHMRKKMQQLLHRSVTQTQKPSQNEALHPVVGKSRVRRAATVDPVQADTDDAAGFILDAVECSWNAPSSVGEDRNVVFHVGKIPGKIPSIVVHPPDSDEECEEELIDMLESEDSDLSCSLCDQPTKIKRRKPRTNLSITIPKHNGEEWDMDAEERERPPLVSANTYAVNLLEEMSLDLMNHFPNLLERPIHDLLAPLQEGNELPYEFFASAVRPVFSLQLAGVFTNVWQKLSLVMELVKETMVVGNFDENMMEVMVEHSTKFFMENIVDSVKEEGGWDVLNVREMHGKGMRDMTGRNVADAPSGKKGENVTSDRGIYESVTSYRWMYVTVVLLAVGLGLICKLRRRL